MHEDKLLTLQDLADYLQMPLRTVRHYKDTDRTLPAIRIGKHVRFRQRDVDAWLDLKAGAA